MAGFLEEHVILFLFFCCRLLRIDTRELIVVIGGIISSTILTLLVLPALYVLFRKDLPSDRDHSESQSIEDHPEETPKPATQGSVG